MNTRTKIMGLAALPLAGLLATGGAALAQTAGTPAGTQVVQQATVHKAGDPCPEHAAKTAAQQVRDRDRDRTCDHQASGVKPAAQQVRDRDRDRTCDHQAVKTTAVTVAHSHHDGNRVGHDDR